MGFCLLLGANNQYILFAFTTATTAVSFIIFLKKPPYWTEKYVAFIKITNLPHLMIWVPNAGARQQLLGEKIQLID